MFKRLLNWWLCLGETPMLHETKIKFFEKAKNEKIKHTPILWSLAKMTAPCSLISGDIDSIIADAKGRSS